MTTVETKTLEVRPFSNVEVGHWLLEISGPGVLIKTSSDEAFNILDKTLVKIDPAKTFKILETVSIRV